MTTASPAASIAAWTVSALTFRSVAPSSTVAALTEESITSAPSAASMAVWTVSALTFTSVAPSSTVAALTAELFIL